MEENGKQNTEDGKENINEIKNITYKLLKLLRKYVNVRKVVKIQDDAKFWLLLKYLESSTFQDKISVFCFHYGITWKSKIFFQDNC